jgi:hypothetical protein
MRERGEAHHRGLGFRLISGEVAAQVASDGEVLVVLGDGGDVDEVRIDAVRTGARSTSSIYSCRREDERLEVAQRR